MGLFSREQKPGKSGFPITEPDKDWVIENFQWLVKMYGLPPTGLSSIIYTEEFFPLSIGGQGNTIENLLCDLKAILQLDHLEITYECIKDIRDTENVFYEIEGQPFRSELKIELSDEDPHYHIILANSLLKYDKQLMAALIYELTKITLHHDGLSYNTGEDADLFLYIASVYYGFGPLLYQSLVDTGVTSDGMWERKWSFVSDLPEVVMAYVLACNIDLKKEAYHGWKQELSSHLSLLLETAVAHHQEQSISLIPKDELEAEKISEVVFQHMAQYEWDKAIEFCEEVLPMDTSNPLKGEFYVNLGYAHLRRGDLGEGIKFFNIAGDFSVNEYVLSNMTYAMIMSNMAQAVGNMVDYGLEFDSIASYARRNAALYHQAMGNISLAKEYYQKALAVEEPTDLLEFHYAEFLLEQGQKEEALIYLQKSFDKGEPEGIELWELLNK